MVEPPRRRGIRVLGRAVVIVLGVALVAVLATTLPARESGAGKPNSSGAGGPASDAGGPARTGRSGLTSRAARFRTSTGSVFWPTRGRLVTRVIPGKASGFQARRAFIYLPPVLRRAPGSRVPVLVLLHGTPGEPGDWVHRGALVRTMDTFAAAHGGRAPIVVMPDINGRRHADTECVNGPAGNVETYLTRDVPDYVRAHLPADPPGRRWAIAGLSEGATCSLMLAARHPGLFSTIGFFSGLARPTVGRTDDPSATVAQLFGGSLSSYEQHDPLWLLRHGTYRSLAVWLECGSLDGEGVAASASIAAAARSAGMPAVVRLTPGRHRWSVWKSSLRQVMPWMWARIGT